MCVCVEAQEFDTLVEDDVLQGIEGAGAFVRSVVVKYGNGIPLPYEWACTADESNV